MIRVLARSHVAPGRVEDNAIEPAGKPRVSVESLSKHFVRAGGERVAAIDDVSIEVDAGEFVVLLGPSGCGKTTLLRCIAGLEEPERGEVRIDDRLVFSGADRVDIPPEKRRISMLFQSYALWPHMTVFDNVAYPLRARGIRGRQIAEEVAAALDLVQCGHLTNQHPGAISGGQQQRVALARALVSSDGVILFDEPLSNVDAKVREELRVQLRAIQERLGFSAIYVTHDQEEALSLADRIAVLGDGKVAQIGTPQEIYRRPVSAYVARFVGAGTEITGRVTSLTPFTVSTGFGSVTCAAEYAQQFELADQVLLIIRPESGVLQLTDSQSNTWPCKIITETFTGPHYDYKVKLSDGTEVKIRSLRRFEFAADKSPRLAVDAEATIVVAPT